MTLGLPGVGAADALEKTLKEERKRYYKDGMWLGVEARMGAERLGGPTSAFLNETKSLAIGGPGSHFFLICPGLS